MPDKHILLQPLDFIVPENDREAVQDCIHYAIGKFAVMVHHDDDNVYCTFDSYIEMKAAEDVIRKVFAQEIKDQVGFWKEWDLSE